MRQAIEYPFVSLMILGAFGLLIYAIYLAMPHHPRPETDPVPPAGRKQSVRRQMLINVTMLFSFLAAIPVMVILLFGVGRLTGLVSTRLGWPAILGAEHDTYHNWLELCSFTANILVAGVAWFAVRFASSQAYETRRQAREAERARSAEVHLHITSRYVAQSMTLSRVLSQHVYSQADTQEPARPPAERYHAELSRLRLSSDLKDMQTYMQHIEILGFFEDVGMLIRKQYVRFDDIRKLFGGPIAGTFRIFGHHISERQKEAPKMFENFLELHAKIAEANAADARRATAR